MTTRIGTTAAYTLYKSQMANIQSRISDKTYQSVTGERYNSYDRYGLSSYRLVTLENEQKVVDQYLENNEITSVTLKSQESAVDSIRSILLDFQSALTSYFSNDLSNMNTTEGITETANVQETAFEAMSQIAYFLNTQVDGVYVFGGGNNTTEPVSFNFKSLEEFQAYYDGNNLTYPTSTQALLSHISVSDSVTGGLKFQQNQIKSDVGLTSSLSFKSTVNDDGSTTGSLSAAAGTFTGLTAGDTLTINGSAINDGTLTVASVSDDGSTVVFAERDIVGKEIIAKADAVANVTLQVNGLTDLDVDIATDAFFSFETRVNADGTTDSVLNGAVGAFSDFQSGDEITVAGTGANDGTYFVKSVSLDGTQIVFADGTTITPEVLNKATAGFDNVAVTQRAVTGTISAVVSDGYEISSRETMDMITVSADGLTLTANKAADFTNVEAGSSIQIGGKTVYVRDLKINGDGTATMTLSAGTPLTDTGVLETVIPGTTIKTLSDVHGFVSDVIKGSEGLTGDVSFNVAKNEITAGVTGAFSSISAGDTFILKGTDGNDGVYYVKSVGSDGRSLQLSDDTKLVNDETIDDGTGVSFGLTYPVSSILDVANVDPSYDGAYSVLGVSADGNTLTVKTDKFKTTEDTRIATGVQSVKSSSYYQGAALENEIRVGEKTSIKLDIDASETAFATIFTALGQIAQGNLIDMRDPETTLDVVDDERVETRVQKALDLITDALSSYSAGDNYSNITNIQYAIVSKTTRLENTTKTQQNLSESLTTYISNIKKVDKTEAVTELLQEQTNLQAAYRVFATLNKMTLLDYI